MNRYHLLESVGRAVLLVAIGIIVLTGWLNGAVFAQTETPPQHDVNTIEGTVRNSAGQGIAGASVFCEEKAGSTSVQTKANADGGFSFLALHPGSYTLRAEKAGMREHASVSLILSMGEKKHLDLVLTTSEREHPASSVASPASPPATMEFDDKPNFTVAGITDWTNAGTHGSDIRARTGEALARETVALKSDRSEEGPATSSANVREADVHRLSGDRKERSGDPLGAVHEYEQAARLDPTEQNYFAWGTELLLHRASQPAVQIFTKGFGAYPHSARMLAGLGAALYASGSSEEAARRLCDAADLNPADPTPYLFLGKMEKAATEPLPCAQEKLARFAREQPGNSLANYYLAVSLWKRARGSQNSASARRTEELLQRAVTLDPKFDEGYLQLGVVYFARGGFEQAIRSYKKAIEANPNLAEAHYRLGLAYKRIGDKAKSRQELQLYKQLDKNETAAIERQHRELRQFMVTLKDQPSATPPH